MAGSMERRTRKVAVGLLMMGGLWVAVYWWWPVSPPVSFAVVGQQAIDEPLRASENPTTQGRTVVSYAPQHNRNDGDGLTSPTPNPSAREGLVSGVLPPKFATHIVEKGETLESISLMYFGTSKHAEAIARANPMLSPPDLKAGKQVLVPLDPTNVQGLVTMRAKEEAIASASGAPQKAKAQPEILQEYQVQEGDSLAKIARNVYGSEKDSDLIFKANRDKLSDPSKIRVGQRLKIPVKPKENG